ncbi:MFS general substrate transporter [Westerdykella ornata]|uniref:MFS general substrate transporter n=1 Tax=Westerdykella ornata TaxID=318751 RepID=A0A6A6JLI1_WESOR|nr:MFS general substrate transporter [Westerdykella ornata]KAF2277520.1 MFS general substrate transporter [Westerdykella ornata]
MLGFHRRTRSLIPVKDLAKYDKILQVEESEIEEEELEENVPLETSGKGRGRQLALVYVMFLAEAIMASSLQPQLQQLIAKDEYCGSLSTSYLRSILDCAYAFGGTAGILWGYIADRIGRRKVALAGLWTMLGCCASMGFATTISSCAIFRFVSGVASSAVMVMTLTMIGDLSTNTKERARHVSRLPLVALCGSIGPIVQGFLSGYFDPSALGSQIACGSLVFLVAVTASFMLKETLPHRSIRCSAEVDPDCEKTGFLSLEPAGHSSVIRNAVRPEPIAISQFLQAPSFLVLLASFSLLSLHASTFDMLLPHLGHSSTHHGGMGIPCDWLGITVLTVRGVAATAILYTLARGIDSFGLLKLYRCISALFPALYIITPLLATLAASSACFVAITSILSILVKHTLAGGASVLVALLVLNTTPDAFSAGTVVGMMQAANLFKALAVAVTGASFYLSSDFSLTTTNYALWTSLALFGVVGAALAWFVRERPSVERDFPSEVLCWETCFDAVDGSPDVP